LTSLFLEADVLFSAVHRPDSAPGLLVEFAAAGPVRAVNSAMRARKRAATSR
jgi:hypothetical protein